MLKNVLHNFNESIHGFLNLLIFNIFWILFNGYVLIHPEKL